MSVIDREQFYILSRDRILVRGKVLHMMGCDAYPGESRWTSMRAYTFNKAGELVKLTYEAGDPGHEPHYQDTRWMGHTPKVGFRIIAASAGKDKGDLLDDVIEHWKEEVPNPWLGTAQAVGYLQPVDKPDCKTLLPLTHRHSLQHLAAWYALLGHDIRDNRFKEDKSIESAQLILHRLGGFIREQNETLVRVNGT